MSSKKVEDAHTELIKKLLTDSGLVCDRSPQFTEESEEEEEEVVEEGGEEEEAAVEQVELEHYTISEEIEPEEYSDLFPTPSLRRFIPERVRRYEAINRIKVLPEKFKTEIEPLDIPRINYTAPKVYIDVLANITGCDMYKSNMAEFWFLDTLANLLRRAQEDDLDRPTQAILILWFCEWMKEMQNFDAASRDRMMRRWRDNMLAAAKVIGDKEFLPNPEEAGVYYQQKKDDALEASSSKKKLDELKTSMGHFVELSGFECSCHDLSKIIHYIYDLFATDFQYNLIRSIFTFGPDYNLIHGPFQLEVPKRLYAVLKPKKETKAKGKKEEKGKKEKSKKDKNKESTEPEEYQALMQLIELINKEEIEKEEKDREDWNRRSSILPLMFATTQEFFDMYWPPPPETIPPPSAVSTLPAKEKGKPGKKK